MSSQNITRNDRDILKGVQLANKKYTSFLTQNGFKTISSSHIGVSFEKKINSYTVNILLNTMGKYYETTTLLTLTISHSLNANIIIAKSIPPLLRIGLTHINSNIEGIKTYTHDAKWGNSIIRNTKMIQFCKNFNRYTSFQILPGELVFKEPVFKEDESAILRLIDENIEHLEAIKQLKILKQYHPTFLQKNITLISISIGVLVVVLIFGVLFFIYKTFT